MCLLKQLCASSHGSRGRKIKGPGLHYYLPWRDPLSLYLLPKKIITHFFSYPDVMSAGGASTSAAFFPLSRKLPRFQVGGGAARIAVLVRRRWIRAGGFESGLGSSWWNRLSLSYGTNCKQLSNLAEDSRVVKSLCQLCRSPVYHWILANNANPCERFTAAEKNIQTLPVLEANYSSSPIKIKFTMWTWARLGPLYELEKSISRLQDLRNCLHPQCFYRSSLPGSCAR